MMHNYSVRCKGALFVAIDHQNDDITTVFLLKITFETKRRDLGQIVIINK